MVITKPHRENEDDICEYCTCQFFECTICLDLFCRCNQDDLDLGRCVCCTDIKTGQKHDN